MDTRGACYGSVQEQTLSQSYTAVAGTHTSVGSGDEEGPWLAIGEAKTNNAEGRGQLTARRLSMTIHHNHWDEFPRLVQAERMENSETR